MATSMASVMQISRLSAAVLFTPDESAMTASRSARTAARAGTTKTNSSYGMRLAQSTESGNDQRLHRDLALAARRPTKTSVISGKTTATAR